MLLLPSAVQDILLRLKQKGYEGYAVGGCVRDMLRGDAVHDYDITTNATPYEMKTVFCDLHVIDTGIQHGTVTVVYQDIPYEITTYRVESGYSDSRHPDRVEFSRSLSDDLCRRDFTINAMALSEEGEVVDLYDGKGDLARRVIRCVGDPKERFSEDALRILRALRFASVLDFTIDEATEAAAFLLADRLKAISVERVATELNKLLCGKGVFRILTRYIDILSVVIPELLPMKGFDQKNYHHCHDVLTHTAKVVEMIPPIKHLRLAALFHDIGKPSTFTLGDDGVGHFYTHPSVSRDMADQILLRLKYDNKTRETVVKLVKWHDHVIEPTESAVKKMLSKTTKELFFNLILLKRADNLGQNPDYHTRQSTYDEIVALASDILARQECLSLKTLSVKGGDLIALGIPIGKRIGVILERLLSEVLNGNLPNEKEELILFVKNNLME